jgi:hypothetical protein
VSTRLPFKGTLKPLLHKPLPQFFDPPAAHPGPVCGLPIGIPFIGEQQGLCSFAFLSAMFPLNYNHAWILGLTLISSDEAFNAGLNEVIEAYVASHPGSSLDFDFDGVTYEITNLQPITGGVPNNIWDQFWNDISEYSYSIGSCWAFVYGQIPSKGGTGTVYVLYTIISYASSYGNSEVYYKAVRGTARPKSP